MEKRVTKNLYISSSVGIHWFRYRNKGLCIDRQPLNFSERHGFSKYLRIWGWKITYLNKH